ncbi:MAG: carbon starvation protein A [Spirochaetia bacterium]|jgi:carbon starvation protein|uniref:CstA N-terminal domain-containing protein n=1 Tax=bioreactor metagenome TaxID=1076179 RepID=A0A644TV23_9ZZZZ|nr:carbon starvation protein A [Spirochaetia bacterium]MCE1209792.1 carbon starvation protein A [Spirochaetia bacterium]NLX44501.1 carbon starvation protein A [Treponema sp.]VBB40183.1 Carbon starvation protein CstA [uncultured Spirochaetota bacterium]
MSTLIALVAIAIYVIFYFTYGKKIRDNVLQSGKAPEAPSKRLNDGVDYVPTSKYVLFGHHFASIAGAGPITGPAMAVAWGWLPGLLWIWFGNIFLGAIHDYLSLVASVRYDGRSMQFVAQDVIGKKAGKTFSWFILFLCVLVVAAFGDIVAGQFAADGRVFFSFVFFCVAAVIAGYFMYKSKLGLGKGTIIGLVLIIAAFWLGDMFPVKWGKDIYFLIIFVYIVLASTLPVNLLLQPRDYLSSYFLYFGLLVGSIAAIFSFKALDAIPAFTSFSAKLIGPAGNLQPSPFWPTVPLIIACGALSGFHSLVSAGTSSKQLKTETDGLFVGYGAMLVEGFLATLVVISIAGFGGLALGDKLMTTPALGRFVNSFAKMVSTQIPFLSMSFMQLFSAVWVSTFALTTLDTTNRLGRYIMQEMAEPLKEKSPGVYNIFHNKWVASLLIAFIGLFLARSGGYTVIWPAFSGANQLLASVVMLTVAVWVNEKLKAKFVIATVLPALLLWVTVVAALIWYEIVIIPVFFIDMAKTTNVITGVVVGLINLFMLYLSFVMLFGFRKKWAERKATAKA